MFKEYQHNLDEIIKSVYVVQKKCISCLFYWLSRSILLFYNSAGERNNLIKKDFITSKYIVKTGYRKCCYRDKREL